MNMDGSSGEVDESIPNAANSSPIHSRLDVDRNVTYDSNDDGENLNNSTRPQSMHEPSKRGAPGAYTTDHIDDKAKRQKFQYHGLCPCCGRNDATLS